MNSKLKFGVTILGLAACILPMTGCGSSPESAPPPAYTDFVDFEVITEQMAADMLSKQWLDNFWREKGRAPIVTVYRIENKSDDRIEQELLTETLRKNLVNSGRARFRAEEDARLQTRVELENDANRDPTMTQNPNKVVPSDFLLRGTITHKRSSREEVGYQFSLQLTNVETQTDDWVDVRPVRLGNLAQGRGRY